MKATTIQRLREAADFCSAYGLEGDAAINHLMTYARVDEQAAIRYASGRYKTQGPSNSHKIARAVAREAAEKQGLRAKGEALVYAKWWRKLLARIFPRLRKRYADWVGRWYKRTLKDWTRQVFASIHDRELQAILRARKKINKQFARKRMSKPLTKVR